jgi:hypothetical protein
MAASVPPHRKTPRVQFVFLVNLYAEACPIKASDKQQHTSEAIYAWVAGFALKMPLKLSRYRRKTRTHNTQATSAGAMLPGAIVR